MEEDSQLLEAARIFNKEALVKIFDLYSSPLYSYALHLCDDPALADEVVGDVFAKLLEQFSAGKGPNSNLRSYLYQTAYHRIIDEQRSTRHRAPLEAIELRRQDVNEACADLEDQLQFRQVLQAIHNCLTCDQEHVVILRLIEGFSLRETAAITGKKIGNIKVIQRRAIVALRRSLNNYRLQRASLPYNSAK